MSEYFAPPDAGAVTITPGSLSSTWLSGYGDIQTITEDLAEVTGFSARVWNFPFNNSSGEPFAVFKNNPGTVLTKFFWPGTVVGEEGEAGTGNQLNVHAIVAAEAEDAGGFLWIEDANTLTVYASTAGPISGTTLTQDIFFDVEFTSVNPAPTGEAVLELVGGSASQNKSIRISNFQIVASHAPE
jgi:hypothetical protein